MPKCPFCRLHTDTGADLQDHIDQKHPEEATDVTGPRRQQRKRFVAKKKTPVVVDGDNIATADGDPSVAIIKKARTFMVKAGYTPIIYVSKKLANRIEDEMEFNRIKNLKWILETDDLVSSLVKTAKKKKCKILTNENYGKLAKEVDSGDWKIKASLINFKYDGSAFEFIN